MFAYAANNPVKYTDPDGRVAVADDVTVGAVFIFLVVAATLAYTQTDAYKESSQNLAEAISYGLYDAKKHVVTSIANVKESIKAKTTTTTNVDAKLKALSLSRTRNRKHKYSITFQAQGSGIFQNIRKGSTQGSKVIHVFSEKPITKKQALGALAILFCELSPKEQENMAGTFIEAAKWIESVHGGYASPYKSVQPKINPTGNRIDMLFMGGYNLTGD